MAGLAIAFKTVFAGRILEEGHIAEYHEYFGPIVLQRAFGNALNDSFNVRQ